MIFRSKSQSEWIELMRDADCCCEPVLSMTEALEHAQTRAREMIRQSSGLTDQLGFSYKLSDTPPRELSHAPGLGEDTDELLAEIGLPEEVRKRLKETGVVA